MPGPPVNRILTSDDIGLGTFEMKVKGTYLTLAQQKYIYSRYLFISPEEEAQFFKDNPQFTDYIDTSDEGPQGEKKPMAERGVKVPKMTKNQIKKGMLSKGGNTSKPFRGKPVS